MTTPREERDTPREDFAAATIDCVADSRHIPSSKECPPGIQIFSRVRGSLDPETHSLALHWLRAMGKDSAELFCSAVHPRKGWHCLSATLVGHGLTSSAFALQIPAFFRESVSQGMALQSIFTRISKLFTAQDEHRYYVCGILLRICDREIEAINAGMPPALLYAEDGRLRESFASRYRPFGIGGSAVHPKAMPQRYRLARLECASLLISSAGAAELLEADGISYDLDEGAAGMIRDYGGLFDRLVDGIEKRMGEAHEDAGIILVPVPLKVAAEPGSETDRPEPPAETVQPHPSNEAFPSLSVLECLDHGLILTDAKQRIAYVNPAFTKITGYTLQESLGRTPRMLSSGRHDDRFYQEMWSAMEDRGEWFGEVWNRRKDGSLFLEWLHLQTIFDENRQATHFLGTFTDVMRMREKDERLLFMAMHDPLTGLANRTLLFDRGLQAIRRADRGGHLLAVLSIDLDRFNSINDSLGNDIGDEVLVSVARRLSGGLRADDTLARIGGDEFVCLLPQIAEREDALMAANRLLEQLSDPVEVAGHHFKIGASIGISSYPSDSTTFDNLIVGADRAMLRAKQAGGNLVRFFTSEMSATLDRQLEMEARLDAAIRSNELVLYYQPKVDLVTNRIIGAEALVRWLDPRSGLVPPGDFVPIAERSDLIVKIGHWVLHEACNMLARNEHRLPVEFKIAINVSPKQFERGDLASDVAVAIAAASVVPGRLQIEVTETVIIRDAKHVSNTLQQISEMGVSIALDDFGTGYSNLASLNRLPIDVFKLDQSFVRDVSNNGVNASIARSVWQLANGLGKDVVAEGIETNEECAKLMSMGYRIGQGYRFGKPMPEEDFFVLLNGWKAERQVARANDLSTGPETEALYPLQK